ncbi:MAG: EAL domain-containing response regulator [Lysobacteraceae bacterium]
MDLTALRVLVVEDHGFQRAIALRLLAELGISGDCALQAADGASALELLRQQAEPPDVVLVDLDMPGMDGIEFITHLTQHRLVRSIAVVSALDPALLNTVSVMASAYGLRMLGVIEKPLTADKLRGLLLAHRAQEWDERGMDAPVEIAPGELRAALEQGAIKPWFQLQVELGNGKPVGVEALARWERGDRIVGPLQFLPQLEREGLSRALTDSILAQACAWRQRWAREHGVELAMAINVAPSTLEDPGVADHYQELVTAHGMVPEDVVLELTESSVLADFARGLGVMARLRLKGFGLSIDDFGVGYSSLAQLSQIPFTELKIDRGFVTDARRNSRHRAVVEASLELARKLHLASVAEGVETEAEWQFLAERGCGLAQGFLISRPVPGEAIPSVLACWRRPH